MHSGWVATSLYPLKDSKLYKLSPLGEVQINGKSAIGLQAVRKGYPDVNMFFDKKTGLLTKLEYRARDLQAGGSEVTKELYLSDYKKVKGALLPHKITLKHDGKDLLKAELTSIDVVDRLDDSTFAKP
jgi:hypothetical protein